MSIGLLQTPLTFLHTHTHSFSYLKQASQPPLSPPERYYSVRYPGGMGLGVLAKSDKTEEEGEEVRGCVSGRVGGLGVVDVI